MSRWRLALAGLVLTACTGVDFEHRIRLRADCPELDPVATVTYTLTQGGRMRCTRMRVVLGPPYREATVLQCEEPVYRESPRERRGRGED